MFKNKNKSVIYISTAVLAMSLAGCFPDPKPDPDPDPEPETGGFDPADKGWSLVFEDNFDGSVIDTSKWAHEVNCWGGGNAEEQCYVDDRNNSFVEDGILHVKAIRGDHTGPVMNPDHPDYDPQNLATKPFSSARMRSVDPMAAIEGQDQDFFIKNDWKYGRFEIRAKLPSGQGTWPAIWMLPTDWEFGGWAMSGEIDIMEAVNLKADYVNEETGETLPENRVHGTLHHGRAWPGNVYSGVEYDFGDPAVNPADDFHVYSVEWEEGEVRWFIDNEHFASQTKEGWYTHYTDENGVWRSSGDSAAPFDQNFHLIMNLAIGGAWAANVNEKGVDADLNEAEMLVDYVRVYQCASDATGLACGVKGEDGSFTLEEGVEEPVLPVAADFSADTLHIFNGQVAGDWQMAKWDDADQGDEYEIVDGYIDLKFSNTGVMYLLSDQSKLDDFTAYGGGEYSFSMRWVEGTATGLKVGFSDNKDAFAHMVVDQQYFGVQGSEEWTTVTVSTADMLTAAPGFDLTSVTIAGKFEQVGGTDLHVQIKDLQMTKGDYIPEEPEGFGTELTLSSDTVAAGFDALLYHGYNEASTDTMTVIDGVINGTHAGGGNISIGSTAGALDMSVFENGEMHFDLRIVDMGSASDVLIKMGSGDWPSLGDVILSETNTGLPVDSQWHSFNVSIADFVANGNRIDTNGVLDLTAVTTPFVVEAYDGGDLQVEVRNVSFSRPLVLLSDAVSDGFVANLYHGYNEGSTDTMTVTGGVINGTHVGGGNVSLASTAGALDMTGYESGEMHFDLRVVDLGTVADILIKMGSGDWPSLGDVALSETNTGLPDDSDWYSFSVPVADFVANGNRIDTNGTLDISGVNTPFVVEAYEGGNLQVEFRNVSFTKN